MLGRKAPERSQSQQLMDELAESYGHLRMAAAHVAGGAAEKVTPTYDKARGAAARSWSSTRDVFSPLYAQMREGAANARREQEMSRRNRWPALVGLLAAGAAVGAAGAMVARRRRAAAEWDDYEPMRSIDDAYHSAEQEPSSATQTVTAGAASVADSVSTQAGELADNLHQKSSAGPTTPDKPAAKASDVTEKPARKPDSPK